MALYAATPADAAAALSAAAAAGLPAGQVTTSFATAWDDTLSGGYLVISVGLAATDALYFNVCGWANPSTDIPGSTPFYSVTGPWDALPGAGAFENAAADSAPLAQQRVTDLAYYAVHDTLPARRDLRARRRESGVRVLRVAVVRPVLRKEHRVTGSRRPRPRRGSHGGEL